MVVDRRNTIGLIALPSVFEEGTTCTMMPLRELPETVSVACAFQGEASCAIGFESGKIWKYHLESRQGRPIGIVSARATAIEALTNTCILVGSADGAVSLIDGRENGLARSVCFRDLSVISGISAWPNGSAAAAVGFVTGAATVFDLRMWVPIWSDKPGPIGQIVPIACDPPGVSYLVMNEEAMEIIVDRRGKLAPKPRRATVCGERGYFRRAFSYMGGAVVVDDESASFIHGSEEVPLYRLFDGSSSRLTTVPCENGTQIEYTLSEGASVHQHEGIVICGTVANNTVVTCDDWGFIHRWKLEWGVRRG
jgi:hypothetical protein